jgi:hypothetical protein
MTRRHNRGVVEIVSRSTPLLNPSTFLDELFLAKLRDGAVIVSEFGENFLGMLA